MPSAQSYGNKKLSSIQDGRYDTLARGSQANQAKHSPGQITVRKLSEQDYGHNSNSPQRETEHATQKTVKSVKDLKLEP